MAPPSTENGFQRLENDLADQLMVRDFDKRDLPVILLVMRLTLGSFGRKACQYDVAAFVTRTGIDESSLRKTIKSLLARHVLLGPPPDRLRRGDWIELNFDVDAWTVPSRAADNMVMRDAASRKRGRKYADQGAESGEQLPASRDAASRDLAPADQATRGTQLPAREATSRDAGHSVPLPDLREATTRDAGSHDPQESGKLLPADREAASREVAPEPANGAVREAPQDTISDRIYDHDSDPPHAPQGENGGVDPVRDRIVSTKIGRMSPELALRLHARLQSLDGFEGDEVYGHYFPAGRGSFLTHLTFEQATELDRYLAHPIESRNKVWAHIARSGDSVKAPYRFAQSALENPSRFSQVFRDRPAAPRPPVAPDAPPKPPLTDDERRRSFSL